MNYRVTNLTDKIKNGRAVARVPGSKSITARALLIAALAEGQSTLRGVQYSDDCATFLQAVKSLGIAVEESGTTVKIIGCGGVLPVRKGEIYVGSAGTAARFLTALCALSDGQYTLTSSRQMQLRPQAPLIAALKAMGAEFAFAEEENCFPFTVRGTACPSQGVSVNIDRSSQYLSALLLSAVCAPKPFTLRAEGRHGADYVGITVKMMKDFGADVRICGDEYTVDGAYSACNYDIEPDVSAACYFYAANKILGTKIEVEGVSPDTVQGDYRFYELLKDFDGGRVDMSAFSDQALTLAAVAPYLSKPTTVCGVAHIRGQECDRIRAAVTNLTALGVKAEEHADGFTVYPSQPHGGVVETYGDHRVAMAFALTGLRCDGVVIRDAEVCSKTFKEYFSVLDGVIQQLTE